MNVYSLANGSYSCPGHLLGLSPMQCNLAVLVKLWATSHSLCTDQGLKQLQTARKRSSSVPAMSLSALCLNHWAITAQSAPSACAWLFERALIHILRALHSAGIGIDTSSNLCSCVVLALVAVRQKCLDVTGGNTF